MLTLQNINNSLIKVSSPKLEELLQNPSSYISLQIEASINCCDDSIVNKTIEFSPLNTICSVCNNTYAWRLDLTDIAHLNREVKGIWVKNLVTGLEYNILNTPISFQSFVDTCGDEIGRAHV